MSKLLAWLKPRSKAAFAFVIALAGGAVAQGLIVGRDAAIVTAFVGAIATLGVYQMPNQKPSPTVMPPETPPPPGG